MTNYYLDIETTGVDEIINKVITIQYQKLDFTGKPLGDLIILKEWESSEKEILQKFINNVDLLNGYDFNFIPVGFNLEFEHKFLKKRAIENGLPELGILGVDKPWIDLKTVGVLMRKGEFKGTSLDSLCGKKGNGAQIPKFYEEKDYQKIVQYIEQETQEFIKFNMWLHTKMPSLLNEFKATLRT